MGRFSNIFENTMALKYLNDQEREINNEYRKILLKKEEIRRKKQ